ncbi:MULTISPECIES: phage tail assembly chaperone G [Bacteria]|uniref:Uncharacterized protein n=1 Tax=Oceanobacillus kimchii TaxID=746691 RepID=A0ABQ5TJT9_9BACI|nr:MULTISPECIES: hypothetical protein [Bacteria]GLO64752.1 hypothetical protein MACH08_05360 [Oceanobacillus kimchii]
MAELVRNMMELVKNPEEVANGGEVEMEKYWTPAFLPLRVSRDAIQLYNELVEDVDISEIDKFDKMADFVANEIYGGKFTKDDLYERLHGPGGKEVLEQQLIFVAQGQQSAETKNFQAKKN